MKDEKTQNATLATLLFYIIVVGIIILAAVVCVTNSITRNELGKIQKIPPLPLVSCVTSTKQVQYPDGNFKSEFIYCLLIDAGGKVVQTKDKKKKVLVGNYPTPGRLVAMTTNSFLPIVKGDGDDDQVPKEKGEYAMGVTVPNSSRVKLVEYKLPHN